MASKDTLLFWRFVGLGLDTDAVRRIVFRLAVTRPEMRILLVGPTQAPIRRSRVTSQLNGLPNVSF